MLLAQAEGLLHRIAEPAVQPLLTGAVNGFNDARIAPQAVDTPCRLTELGIEGHFLYMVVLERIVFSGVEDFLDGIIKLAVDQALFTETEAFGRHAR
jgi:hypothetical protein